ncbi:hypothetical protein FBY06_11840 [Pseudomonas sp. SJZ085]|uniref:hypothetical protein n=1 Tax=unclassified Pseudomonas TaxID=196821 RepID=UPI00119A7BAA|nr:MULTISPECIES: hypothetical protein [unclassified Pseudomonas]TWC17112.1 hypothetical protein FBX99_118104 [Pseudomonas sp. SJZ074]TWC35134.1 hypothetical protein FBY06_11840 [Pseudomonas sp. SJZ085]
MSDQAELSMTNFILDGFLEWLADECDQRRESYTICSTRDKFGRFEMVWVQTSWIAWQASRAALVVELPKAYDSAPPYACYEGGWNDMREEAADAIEAAGGTVKP